MYAMLVGFIYFYTMGQSTKTSRILHNRFTTLNKVHFNICHRPASSRSRKSRHCSCWRCSPSRRGIPTWSSLSRRRAPCGMPATHILRTRRPSLVRNNHAFLRCKVSDVWHRQGLRFQPPQHLPGPTAHELPRDRHRRDGTGLVVCWCAFGFLTSRTRIPRLTCTPRQVWLSEW